MMKRVSCFVFALFVSVLPVLAEGPVGTSSTFRGPVGLQTYSLRNQLKTDGAAALDFVKAQGFKEVEIGLENHYGMSREAMRDALKERGLTPIAAHAGQGFLLNNTEKAIEEAKFFGLKYVGVAWASHKAPMDEAQMLKIADEFNTIGKRLKEHGIQFFYHNHGFEFYPYKDGKTLFDLLMEKTDPEFVKLEMDVLWTIFPGQDPVKLLKQYPDRWVLMHLKDLKKGVEGNMSGGTDKSNDVALGSGQADYPAILKAAQEIGVKHYFIEDESDDVLQQIPVSLAYLSSVDLAKAGGAADDEAGFVSLMSVKPGDTWTENAKALNGWVKYGGDATYEVDGNEIVGKRGPGPNTFLCTEKRFSNFVLKYEFKYEIDCNSGMQFRSNVRSEGDRHRVYGYQCEIDTGGSIGNIYDEGRRGRWIEPFTDEMRAAIRKANKKDEWNEMTIQCVGPSVKTWLNGEKIADLYDIVDSEGFFGLQVHGGEKGQIRWRNIRVKELPATPWISLYSNKTLGAVEKKPVGKWEILEDGSLQGTTEQGEPRDGMLNSLQQYKNFAVKVSFKMVSGNSGLYFRAQPVDKPYWYRGFQCEIAEGAPCSGLWEVQGRGWVAKNEELAKEKYKTADWNDVGTVAIGDHLITYLNGWKAIDIVDPDCLKEGYTGLQLHGGGNQGFLFRDYFIMPLDDKAVELMAQ